MKYWVTKDALKTGKIRQIEGEIHIDRKMLLIETGEGACETFWGSEWHETRQAALEEAEARRQSRIKKLKTELAKLEKMSFT